MQEPNEEHHVQHLAIRVSIAGPDTRRAAAKFCNTSMTTIDRWATQGFASYPEDRRSSVLAIAKKGLNRALDGHNGL